MEGGGKGGKNGEMEMEMNGNVIFVCPSCYQQATPYFRIMFYITINGIATRMTEIVSIFICLIFFIFDYLFTTSNQCEAEVETVTSIKNNASAVVSLH